MTIKIYYESDNSNYEPRDCLIIEHNSKRIIEKWDGGEPEDNYFCRDWNWVAGALETVYSLGFEDGFDNYKEFHSE